MRTSIDIPDRIYLESRERALDDGYSPRKYHLWLSEAILMLVENDKGLRTVGAGSKLDEKKTRRNITLTDDASDKLLDAAKMLRRQSPLISGPRAKVIRAAMVYRLNSDDKGHYSGDRKNTETQANNMKDKEK